MLRGDGGRADDDLGAVRPEHVALVLADLVGADEDAVVALAAGRPAPGRRRCCRRSARRSCRRAAARRTASAASTIRSAIRSFTEPPGLRYSTLASTVHGDAPVGDGVELDQGGVPDQVGDVLGVLHRPILDACPHGRAALSTRPGAPRSARTVVRWTRTSRGGRWRRTCDSEGGCDGTGTARAPDRADRGLRRRRARAGIGVLGRARLRPAQGRGA